MGSWCFTFQETPELFSQVAVPSYIPSRGNESERAWAFLILSASLGDLGVHPNLRTTGLEGDRIGRLFLQEVTLEQRPGESEGVRHEETCEKTVLGKGDRTCRTPNVPGVILIAGVRGA